MKASASRVASVFRCLQEARLIAIIILHACPWDRKQFLIRLQTYVVAAAPENKKNPEHLYSRTGCNQCECTR